MPENSAFNIPQSPIATLGTIVLLLAFLVAAYGAAAGLIGNAQRRRRLVNSSVYALYGLFALMVVASALMIYAFLTHDYTIKYVYHYSDTTMPLWYKITAYWGGLDGSLMFWVAVLAAFSAVAIKMNRHRHRDMIGYVVATILLVQIFFLALLIYNKNPFATFLTRPPLDGKGLNPLLQNYWMVIHPPSLYVGYIAATIPFAFSIGALASGRLDDMWLGSMRSWMMICWFFLSLGLILGGRWAYEELGWGGYWAWDPVENAGLLPWFTASAFLHSIMIQEQRGMMKVWNIVLAWFTFFLTIFGTFMTRSGVVQSVHSFGEDNELALLFVLFMAVIWIVPVGLIIFRAPKLRSRNTFESFISREYAFLVNNWILLACALFVLFATMFPTISEAIDGERISVGIEFFNKWMIPLGLALLFLAGAAPLLAWRKTTRDRLYSQLMVPTAAMAVTIATLAIFLPQTRVNTTILADWIRLPITLVNFGLVAFVFVSVGQEFWKGVRVRRKQTGSDPLTSFIGLLLVKRRKYGGYVIHAAVALMFLGFAGQAYESERDFTLPKPGETVVLKDYTFRYDDLVVTASDQKRAVTARITVLRDGEVLDTLEAAQWKFFKQSQDTTEVAIRPVLSIDLHDVYIVLTGYSEADKLINVRIKINPLVNWVWLGFGLLILGTFLCLIPQRVVENVSPQRRTRVGRAADVAILVAAVVGATLGLARMAHAQPAEHADEAAAAGGGHTVTTGAAHLCKPAEAENPALAKKLMKELVCVCGGCKRETLHECRCGFAAQKRCEVLSMLGAHDLSTEASRAKAYDDVIEAFIRQAGGQHVLATPRNKLSWIVPYAAIAGGLLLLYGLGRRWVGRGEQALTEAAAPGEEEDRYAELLDDELRDTD